MSKIDNVKSVMKDPRARSTLLLTFGALAVIVIILIVILNKSGPTKKGEASSLGGTPEVSGDYQMSGQTTAEYDQLLQQRNQESSAEALKQGGTAISIPRSGTTSLAEGFNDAPSTEATVPAAATEPTQAMPAAPTYDAAEYHRAMEAQGQAVARREEAMRKQLELLQGRWEPQNHTSIVIARPQAPSNASAGAPPLSQTGSSDAAAAADVQVGAGTVRAGRKLYATLDTFISTDEPGPVTATIQEPGPLKGATLLGQISFNETARAVGVQFNSMSVPGEATARSITAWAFDPERGDRAGLASRVNNHYIANGVKLFIGAFGAGYADGLLRGGQSERVISTGSAGNVVVEKDAYSTRELTQIGLGNVARTYSQNISQNATRKRTVEVDQKIDIGVLFLQDSTAAR
ncbi:DotG/IcmE/VirB10 family protein [Stenotrophomonas maltophilia]|uniref:DotG/IcmE/VirB10 family protein n=1 Tax=Stenotrophomonas maltophilia TaxID=40324 RepID=UPI000B4CDC1A|nr:DotG/IcmE/VirB10 family protein [Stenotrophomonas maltophilia]OWQ61261.1 hypothetical protein CEE58_15640 [Stenotrophomonas maltophilia]